MELVALLQLQPRKDVLRQNETERITDLPNLKDSVLELVLMRGFVETARGFCHVIGSVIHNV
jgi:hypothetical protein